MKLCRNSGRRWVLKACDSSIEPVALTIGHPLQQYTSEFSKASRVWIAYSGGLDSSVLLSLATECIPTSKLIALHINHGLHPDAASWEKFCRRESERLGIEFLCLKVQLNGHENLEERAREARYGVFQEKLGQGEILLTAHHANDQAETILFRMMRGAGPRGLQGMPHTRPLGQGALLRPLINIKKSELEGIARQRSLDWIEDPSNENSRFSRNYIRREIIPRLEEHWPAAVVKINQSAAAIHEASGLLATYANELAERCDLRPEVFGSSLDLSKFNVFNFAKRQLVLRQLLSERGLHPDTPRLEEILAQLHKADSESHISDRYDHVELGVFQMRLFLLQLPKDVDVSESYRWDPAVNMVIPNVGTLLASDRLAGKGTMQVRFRQGGERAHPVGRRHSQSLKKLLQEYEVPPWLRTRIPLIYMDNELVAVAGLFSCVDGVPPPPLEWQRCSI